MKHEEISEKVSEHWLRMQKKKMKAWSFGMDVFCVLIGWQFQHWLGFPKSLLCIPVIAIVAYVSFRIIFKR